jgi:hypothetical protein
LPLFSKISVLSNVKAGVMAFSKLVVANLQSIFWTDDLQDFFLFTVDFPFE